MTHSFLEDMEYNLGNYSIRIKSPSQTSSQNLVFYPFPTFCIISLLAMRTICQSKLPILDMAVQGPPVVLPPFIATGVSMSMLLHAQTTRFHSGQPSDENFHHHLNNKVAFFTTKSPAPHFFIATSHFLPYCSRCSKVH